MAASAATASTAPATAVAAAKGNDAKGGDAKAAAAAAVSKDDMRTVVLSFPSMDKLAASICAQHPLLFRRGTISWKYFPDGWPNISFEHVSLLENRHVVFLGSLHDRTKVLEQISMIMVLPRQFVASLSIVMPYFAPGTMERVDEEGQLATAETTAKILSACIPQTRSGPAVLRVFDIHALPIRFYFGESVMMRMMSAVPLLQRVCPPGQTTIAFPDEGALKRFKKAFGPEYPLIVCSKTRDGDKRIISIAEKLNFPKDKAAEAKALEHVVVVDDLAQSGSTLHECRLAIQKALGVKHCSAYVTHPVFPNEGWRKFLDGGEFAGMHRFYMTNTVPEVATAIDGQGPFRLIDIADALTADLITTFNLKPPAAATAASVPATTAAAPVAK